MKFFPRMDGDVVILELKGGLEGGPSSYQIKDVVREQLEAGQRKFLINLDKVNYVNSTGIGIMASIYSSISNAGGQMKICNAKDKVSRVMMVTKLLEVFDSYTHEEDALGAFRGA